MKVVVQRVSYSSVIVAGEKIAEIGRGLVILVGVKVGDGIEHADGLAEKCANLRIFEDEAGKLNRSVLETGGHVLAVSQFTVYANAEKGRRPSFIEAAPPEQAEPLVTRFVERLQALGVPTQTGKFRAEMLVQIYNDGPVTIILEK